MENVRVSCSVFASAALFVLAAAVNLLLPWPRGVFVNLLKPSCYAMHHQFNIQQLYILPTLYLCVLYLSENKQRLVPLTA